MNLLTRVAQILPPTVARRLRDRLEAHRRHHPAPHRGRPEYGLTSAQVYPSGTHFDTCLEAGLASTFDGLVIQQDTPVASLGSCFADEFALHMRRTGFNYVTTEAGTFPASANWGRVYTIPAFRQIVRYSTDETFPVAVEQGPGGWFDPLRDPAIGHFPTRVAAAAAIGAHRAASRRAFATARVLILTLGQNEAWVDPQSNLVWASRPPQAILDEAARPLAPRTFSFEDDVDGLEDALDRLTMLNPDLKVLVTVSPVASYATFCGVEAITQSFAAKAILRAVADRITHRRPRVWYFPAFEMALAYNPHTLRADNRHVTPATVNRIFALLIRTLVR
jgi:hypothetical protein